MPSDFSPTHDVKLTDLIHRCEGTTAADFDWCVEYLQGVLAHHGTRWDCNAAARQATPEQWRQAFLDYVQKNLKPRKSHSPAFMSVYEGPRRATVARRAFDEAWPCP